MHGHMPEHTAAETQLRVAVMESDVRTVSVSGFFSWNTELLFLFLSLLSAYQFLFGACACLVPQHSADPIVPALNPNPKPHSHLFTVAHSGMRTSRFADAVLLNGVRGSGMHPSLCGCRCDAARVGTLLACAYACAISG